LLVFFIIGTIIQRGRGSRISPILDDITLSAYW
jgi:hypothetical protein